MTVFTNTLKRIFRTPQSYPLLLIFPIVFAILISLTTSNDTNIDVADMVEPHMAFGIIDNDNSVLSGALISSLETSFSVKHVKENDITAVLTDQQVPWILLIPKGYGENIIDGVKPNLEGHSLTISDVSQLGAVNAESITRSLMLLGTEDEKILNEWAEKGELSINRIDNTDNWEAVTFWFGFFGFASMLSVSFIARVLIDDKRKGMPDRLGVIPISQCRFLINSALSVFAATEVTVALMIVAAVLILGAIPNVFMLLIILSLYNLFAVSSIMAIFSFAKDMGAISVIVSILSTVFAMIGGSFWPLELAPPFMQKVAWFSPNYWLARGIGGLRELNFSDYGMSLLFLLAFTVVVIFLGGWNKIQKMNDGG